MAEEEKKKKKLIKMEMNTGGQVSGTRLGLAPQKLRIAAGNSLQTTISFLAKSQRLDKRLLSAILQ